MNTITITTNPNVSVSVSAEDVRFDVTTATAEFVTLTN
jgi:hypothetical protein